MKGNETADKPTYMLGTAFTANYPAIKRLETLNGKECGKMVIANYNIASY